MLLGQDVVPATLLETPASALHLWSSLPRAQGAAPHAARALTSAPCASAAGCWRISWQRRERIRAEVNSLATALNGRALIDEELLEEVTALVEWPVALAGHFEERFLALPREVLISTLQEHQRYFPLEDAAGTCCPRSSPSATSRAAIRPRCARATSAWCARAWRTRPSSGSRTAGSRSAARVTALDAVTFQAKLGSLGDKTRRVIALATDVAVADQRAAR